MTEWTNFLDPEGPDGAYLPWKRVEARVGISRTTAWRLQRAGDFPKPYVVSPGRVAYKESEVEAWKASRGHRDDQMARSGRSSAGSRAPPETASVGESACTLGAGPAPTAAVPAPGSQTSPHGNRKRRDSRQITFDF